MRRIHIYAAAILLTLIALGLGAFKSDLPVVNYFGNAVGVLLGFILGVWWQEQEKSRARKEDIDRFWKAFATFIPRMEERVRNQKASTYNAVFDSIIEYRLPLHEIQEFRRRADELQLKFEFCSQLAAIVSATKIIEEYIDFGAERIKKWHTNFSSKQEELYRLVLEIRKLQPNPSGTENGGYDAVSEL